MPIKEWIPTARQSDFISLPDEIFEALYGGAAGGGKSETLLMLPVVKKDKRDRPLYEHHKFKMLFLRRTFPELDSEIIPRSKEFYPHFGFLPYQDQKRRWTHQSGSIIQFGHCEHEGDVKKYDTSEYNIIAFDESTSFTPFQYEYLTFSRCRTSSLDLPAIVRSGTNPGNIGHSYFRTRFVQPARQGNVLLNETRTVLGKAQTLLRIYIPSKATDNTYLMAADPDYVNRLNRLPAAERAAKADGDWWTFSGQVFEDWRTEPFPDEPRNAQHVCEPFQIPSYWPKVLSIDWGYAALTIGGWYAINPCPSVKYPAKIYKYREYTCKKTKISTWAADMRRLSGEETYTDLVMDPSGWQERGDPVNIAEQFAKVFGRQPRKAQNNRVGGKLLLQELLRWRPRPARYVPQSGFNDELASKIRRMQGPAAYEEYCKLFLPEEEERFLPQFQVFSTCAKTIETIPLCVYDKDRPEDVAEFDGDDPYDETRYGVSACQNYLDGGLLEANHEAEVASVCSTYEQTGNINQFYMMMNSLDAKRGKESQGIRRFHSGRNRSRMYANY